MLRKVMAILGAVGLLCTLIGSFIYYEDRNISKYASKVVVEKLAPLSVVVALADDLGLTIRRLDQKIVHDKIDRAKSQMLQIRISCKTNNPLQMNIDAQRNYYQLQQDLIILNRELQQINSKGEK